ncbi:PREDICTED: aminoacylase-1-like [Camelina sativa]|uniref:Aminoacylase-1-like n=1 Tax=Camelina sativa TaxID=90675 RepID=A0ABM0YFG7_CAMSA|nr:PREDICTED: aminoacylase-1-like [Camelina sativa]
MAKDSVAVSSLLWTLFLISVIFSLQSNSQEEDTPITRFQQYLRINTAHPNPNYTAAVSFLLDQARSIGLTSRTIEFVPGKPVLLLTWLGSNSNLPSILFNSHLDSVPAESEKWIHPPFSAHRTVDGHIYARGAQDDKCVGVQYLEAIKNLKSRGFSPLRTVHVSYVPEEENGGFDGMMKFAASLEFTELNLGFVMDEGQASPADEFRVFYAERTPWHLYIRAEGIPGHGAKLYDNSAMENLMKSVELISKFRETQFDLVKAGKALTSEVISVNPVYLKAGTPSTTGFVMNMQPSEAEAGYDLRLPPTADPDLMEKRIAEEWAPSIRNMTYIIKLKGNLRDHLGRAIMTPIDDTNPWWSIFKQAVEATGGKLAKPEVLLSTTDSRYIRPLGIPVLGFSPMSNTPVLVHDHNEFLKDTVFVKGIEVYETVISALSSFKGVSAGQVI